MATRSTRKRFVVCLRNDGYEVSLERRKIYEVLPDGDAARHKQMADDRRIPVKIICTRKSCSRRSNSLSRSGALCRLPSNGPAALRAAKRA